MTASTGPRLILWDIDGTLLTTGPIGRLALEAGARAATGLDLVPEVDMGGKTDPQIVREILAAGGLNDHEIEVAMPVALAAARRRLATDASRISGEGRLHPGVRELLVTLSATEGVRQSLVTGNIAPNAQVKVTALGIDRHFDFEIGAYGDDHEDRDCLVPIALDRVRRLRGEVYAPDAVWVIGDTASDLRCANAAGVRCLVVGTGRAGLEAVAGLEADAVLPDLSDTDLVMKILLGRRRSATGDAVGQAVGR